MILFLLRFYVTSAELISSKITTEKGILLGFCMLYIVWRFFYFSFKINFEKFQKIHRLLNPFLVNIPFYTSWKHREIEDNDVNIWFKTSRYHNSFSFVSFPRLNLLFSLLNIPCILSQSTNAQKIEVLGSWTANLDSKCYIRKNFSFVANSETAVNRCFSK